MPRDLNEDVILGDDITFVRQFWPWWRWALTGLSALALALSAYLSWHYLTGWRVIGCGDGSPCDEVLNSRWSTVGGVLPVTGLAAGDYLAMFIASFSLGQATEMALRRLAWRVILVLVGAAFGSAVWFTVVQKWIIGSFCPYCMAAHTIALLLATLVVWQGPRQLAADTTEARLTKSDPAVTPPRHVISRLSAVIFLVAGIGLAGIMAICQAAIIPPSEYRRGESDNTLPAIDPHTAPLVGSPDATYIVTLLFDYKCPHCQQLHFMLGEAIRRYRGKLAIALCPAPLNTHCNPYIPRDVDEFAGSCELAKIALTVWVAKREAFPAFDLWMFSLESGDRWRPRSLDAAKAKAIELVGETKFKTASADPWVDHYLQTSIRIYGNTIQDHNNAIPKLVFGPHWVIPQPNDVDDLISILHDSLTVPRP